MRWEQLFADLEAQLEAEDVRELALEVADRTRRERALVGVPERLLAHRGRMLQLRLLGGQVLAGEVVDVGLDWCLLAEGAGRRALVPTSALLSLSGLTGAATTGTAARMARRFGFGHAARGLSRDRAVVAVADIGGSTVTGTIDAVGADALELSEHASDLPRRPENVIARRAVPFTAVASVRTT
jgi:hypothetical protein